MYLYKDLDKHFTAPNGWGSKVCYNYKKIPRKLKKSVKPICGCHWKHLNNTQRLWYALGYINPNYKRFLIKKICDYYGK